jgi:hypothetical protein
MSSMGRQQVRGISKADALRLAAETGLDPRTVMRAARLGLGQMQAKASREKLRAAAVKLKMRIVWVS